MNKFWKSTLVFVLIIGFLVSMMVCCCVTSLAQAAIVQIKTESTCCHTKASRNENKTKKCNTCLKNNSRAEACQTFKIVSPPTYVWKFLSINSISFIPRIQLPIKSVSLHGPPASLPKLPIYLKNHSLRI